MPLSRIKPQMESSQLRLDSSAASTDVNERVLLNGVDSSSTGDGYAVILEDATANAFDGGPFVLSEAPISVANPAFKAIMQTGINGDQAVSNNTSTKVQFKQKVYDIGGYYDNVTNYRYTPLIAGYYQITASLQEISGTDVSDIMVQVKKNGGDTHSQGRMKLMGLSNDDMNASIASVTDVIHMTGTTDYLEVYIQSYSEDSSSPEVNDLDTSTFFAGHLLTRTS